MGFLTDTEATGTLDFKVNTSRDDEVGASIISIEGELDIETVNRVYESAEAAISERSPVLVDLSKCHFIDSTGLRLVLRIHHGLSSGDRPATPMAVLVPDAGVRKLFSVTGIDVSVPIFRTRDEALEFLRD